MTALNIPLSTITISITTLSIKAFSMPNLSIATDKNIGIYPIG
jgi:hypothetical protein